MTDSLKIVGISGSLRKGSLNTKLLHVAEGMLPASMTMEIYPLNDLPMYNGDLETDHFPEAVERFRQKIYAADGVLMACPEYNYSVTGALKNAIDWASRKPLPNRTGKTPLEGKPVAIVGIGARFGTVRAQLHLRQIAVNTKMLVVPGPEVVISSIPNKPFTDQGELADPNSKMFLGQLLEAFEEWIYRFKAEPETVR